LYEHIGVSGDVTQRRTQVVGYGISETLQLDVCLRQIGRAAFQPFIHMLQILFSPIAPAGFPVNHKPATNRIRMAKAFPQTMTTFIFRVLAAAVSNRLVNNCASV
jgi:hypothetical protein